jgi:hypothetical protein
MRSLIVPLGLAAVAAAGPAHAITHTIYDQTLVYGYNTNSSAPNNATAVGVTSQYAWTDVIGSPDFNTKKIQVIRDSGDLVINIFTNYGLNTGTTGGSNPVELGFPTADVAFDLDGDMHFEYGVAMTTRGSFSRGSLYQVADASGWTTSWDSSVGIYDDNGGYVIGGRYDNCTKGVDCETPPNDVPPPPYIPVVKMTSASLVQAGTVAQAATGETSGNYNNAAKLDSSRYVTTITLAGLLDAVPDWNGAFNLFTGTAWCSNDGVWAEVPNVPIPAALPMLLAAVGGLALASRHARANT